MPLKLSNKIIIACAVWLILPLALLGLRFYRVSSDLLRDQLKTTNLEHVKHIDAYYLTHVNDNLDFFLNLWVDESISQALESKWEHALMGYPEILSIYFADASGNFFNVPSLALPQGYDPTVRPWYLKALDHPHEVVWTSPYQDAVTEEMIFTVARTIFDTSENFLGVLAIDVTLVEMTELMELTRIGDEGRVMIIDAEGSVIVSPDQDLLGQDISDRPWAQKLFASDYGSYQFELDEALVISYTTNKMTGWKVVGVVPERELSAQIAPFRSLFYRVLWVVALWALIGIGGFIFYLHAKIIKRIGLLQTFMKKAESGDLDMPLLNPGKNPDEIEMLFISFNHMIQSQIKVLNQIKESSKSLNDTAKATLSIASAYTDSAHEQAAEMEGLNVSVERMNASINQIKNQMDAATQDISFVNSAMKEMGLSASDVANSAVSTSEAISDVLTSLETLDAEIRQINENVVLLKEKGNVSVQTVHLGKQSLTSTSNEMNTIRNNSSDLMKTIDSLGHFAEEIGDIISIIEDLTEQTSMLSINASIEASRAGEHGKGFAAVASAIGRLSEKSKLSTRSIEKLIKRIQHQIHLASEQTDANRVQIEKGVHQTLITLESFNTIESAVLKTSESIEEIALSTDKQLHVSRSILDASIRVNDLTMLVSASSQEQLATVEELSIATHKINALAEKISNETNTQSESSHELTQVSDAINTMTLEMSSASKEIESVAIELSREAETLVTSVSHFNLRD